MKDAIHGADAVFIAVGTPPGEDGSADLQHVLAVARDIGRAMDEPKIVVTKSTVPVGTAEKVRAAIQAETELPVSICSNPEFLKEGAAIEDFMRPDRIIVGADDARAIALLRQLYAPFQRNRERIIVMGVRSAELTKYAANAMLATRISFMNEIANVCELFGADVDKVRLAIASDKRIGSAFLFPGVGYGGSCFPKDVKALVHFSGAKKYRFRILEAVEAVNEQQKLRLVEKLDRIFGAGGLKGKHIGVWGLAFKPRTDDMREAPSRDLMEAVWAAGGKIRAYDPVAMHETEKLYGKRADLVLAESPDDALAGADALAIVTEWRVFASPNFEKIAKALKTPVIFDGRNLYEPKFVEAAGIAYYAIGRGRA